RPSARCKRPRSRNGGRSSGRPTSRRNSWLAGRLLLAHRSVLRSRTNNKGSTMGQLVDGKWMSGEVLRQHDEIGRYFKRPAVFREHVTANGSSGFPAETRPYHLYFPFPSPWAHPPVLFRVLKQLDPHTPLWNPVREGGGGGWSFGPEGHVVPGSGQGVRWLRELYPIADPACTSRVTVPTLWDAQTCQVINNESSEII